MDWFSASDRAYGFSINLKLMYDLYDFYICESPRTTAINANQMFTIALNVAFYQ